MRQWKRILSAGLAATLLAGLLTIGAAAAEFTKTKTYQEGQFTDVTTSSWFANDVKTCYELGLMSGAGEKTFNPGGMFTLAESATIAARLHHIYNDGNGTIPAAAGEWYAGAVQYCREKGILSATEFDGEFGRSATRAEMAYLLCNALPADMFSSKNAVTRLPDVTQGTPYSEAIITFYQAGIFTGGDEYGTFQPYAYITRAEVAAIVARVAQPATRKVLNLKDSSQREAPVLNNDADKVSNGRIRFQDPTTKLYGYQDTNGSVVIPAQYESAEHFSGGYAVVRKTGGYGLIDVVGKVVLEFAYAGIGTGDNYPSGVHYVQKDNKYGLSVNGKVTVQPTYFSTPEYNNGNYKVRVYNSGRSDYGIITSGGKTIVPVKQGKSAIFNGVYGIALGSDSTDVYDREGKLLKTYDAVKWANNSNLLAVRDGSKWALATDTGYITEAIYDDVTLTDDSDLVIVKYGVLEGLAGLNGGIIAPGTYDDYSVKGEYAVCKGEESLVLAKSYGVVAETACTYGSGEPYFIVSDGYVFVRPAGYYKSNVYARGVIFDKTGQSLEVNSINLDDRAWITEHDDTDYYYLLRNGVVCGPYLDYAGSAYWNKVGEHNYHAVDGSYGIWDHEKGELSRAIFDTKEEATQAWRENFAQEYSVQRNAAGKPYLGRGNKEAGYEPVIEFYKNNLYYDEIKPLGEDWYRCRYNTTWYLVHP